MTAKLPTNLGLLCLITLLMVFSACEKEVENSAESAPKKSDVTAKNVEPISAVPATEYNEFFTRYGNGWTGGDGAYSMPLPDGRVLWSFGDSFIDTVYPNRTRPGSPFARNSFMIQQGMEATSYFQGTASQPQAYVANPRPGEWYWPGDGTVHNNRVYMLMLRFKNEGSGMFGFQFQGTDLAVFSLPDFQLLRLKPILNSQHALLGATVMEQGQYLYLYSSYEGGFGKTCLASRIKFNELETGLQWWTGAGWSTTAGEVAFLKRANGLDVMVSSQFSVFEKDGQYYLLTQEDFFGSGIYLYQSASPTGPWGDKTLVYETPESGGDIWTYNAFIHPHIQAEDGAVLLTYSVNSLNFGDLFSDADVYKPRAVWVNGIGE